MQSPNSKQSEKKHNSVTSINYIANGLIKKRSKETIEITIFSIICLSQVIFFENV